MYSSCSVDMQESKNGSYIQYKAREYTYAEEIFRLIRGYCGTGRLEFLGIHFDKSSLHEVIESHIHSTFSNE